MSVKYVLRLAAIASMCAVMCTGCKTCNPETEGNGTLEPTDVGQNGEDIRLTPWNSPGNRITDVTMESVLFDFDSAQIRRSEFGRIEEAANYLKRNSNVRMVLEGNCDERGTLEYNMALGERRALAVREYLVGLGIGADRMLTKSFGEENPQDGGHSEAAWKVNRRVEFALYR